MDYTTVDHTVRRKLKLTNDEYVLCDLIYRLSTNPKAPRPGWCTARRKWLQKTTGISKSTLWRMIDRLKYPMCLIDEDIGTGHLQTTEKWHQHQMRTLTTNKQSIIDEYSH